MKRINKLDVYFNERLVGSLVETNNLRVAFEYSESWLSNGFSISPFSLPLEKKVFISKLDPFDGIFGVFADSLPDGWGKLLVDRFMLSKGIDPNQLTNLMRLSIVGNSGMGALSYKPSNGLLNDQELQNLDVIQKECEKILNDLDSSSLDNLFLYGGSSGGARPKVLTKVDGEDWIIKFKSIYDPKNIGKQEYDYALCAKECGIEIPEVRLFDSDICEGYFGIKRFDRINQSKVHMISVSALLETSHRLPNLDYDLLMKLTMKLTDSFNECLKLYRLMCFNVFAHNRDDHSKNFSFLYLENKRKWTLSPAYDLTYSNSIGGWHATTIAGNGENPSMKDLLEVAKNIGITSSLAKEIAEDIKNKTNSMLKEYLKG